MESGSGGGGTDVVVAGAAGADDASVCVLLVAGRHPRRRHDHLIVFATLGRTPQQDCDDSTAQFCPWSTTACKLQI
jgi:hypothetical protein